MHFHVCENMGKPCNDTLDGRIQIYLKLAMGDRTMIPNFVLSKKGEERLERSIPLWKRREPSALPALHLCLRMWLGTFPKSAIMTSNISREET